MHLLPVSIEKSDVADHRVERIGLVVIAVGLGGIIDGTVRFNSHPVWPSPEIWAMVAGLAMVTSLVAAIRSDRAFRGLSMMLTFGVAVMRAIGYLFATPTAQVTIARIAERPSGPNAAAVGAYLIVIGALIIVFGAWQKEHDDDRRVPW